MIYLLEEFWLLCPKCAFQEKLVQKLKFQKTILVFMNIYLVKTRVDIWLRLVKKNKQSVTKILEKNGIYYEIIGKTQKDSLNIEKEFNVNLENLKKQNSFWFKDYFGEN